MARRLCIAREVLPAHGLELLDGNPRRHQLQVGDRFWAEETDVSRWAEANAIQFADEPEPAPDAPKKKKKTARTPASAGSKKTGRYNRRDMRPEQAPLT